MDEVRPQAPPAAQRRARQVGLALSLALFAAAVARTNFLIDDAYISFRFAKNWSETGVPVFNTGLEPVEGYSNFLWVLLLRFCSDLDLDLEFASRVLSVCFAVLLLGLVHRFLWRKLALAPLAVSLGTLLLATFPPFVAWSTGGLESALHALLLFTAMVLLLPVIRGRRECWRGVAAGLAGVGVALVRVEGFAWVLALAFSAGVAGYAAGERPARRLLPFLAVSAAGFGLFLLWRHSVYGEWMANTAYVKGGISGAVMLRGLKTVASYGLIFGSPVVALAAWPIACRGPGRQAAMAAGGMFSAFLVYNVLVGGDWMPFFRFLAPASPFVAVLLALFFARLRRSIALVVAGACLAAQVLPVFDVNLPPRSLRRALYFRAFGVGYETEWQRWEHGRANRASFRALGKALAQVAKPGDSITLGPIGAIGFFSKMTVYDRNGLVDREVARRDVEIGIGTAGHEKRVPRAWFLDRKPTYFDAMLWTSKLTERRWPGYEYATRELANRVFGDWVEWPLLEDPGSWSEWPLLHHTDAVAWQLDPEDGIPEGAMLVLMRRVDDPARAWRFWQWVGILAPSAEPASPSPGAERRE